MTVGWGDDAPPATALLAPASALDPQERTFVAAIREHGWFRTNVFAEGDNPGFSYTTGFWHGLRRAEIIAVALTSEVAHAVLWDIYRELRAGREFPPHTPISGLFANLDTVFLPVAKARHREYDTWTRWFYASEDYPCLQMVWPDPAGVFPWQPGMDPQYARLQADLTDGHWGGMATA